MTTDNSRADALTDQQHAELLKLEAAATPRPWRYQECSDAYTHIVRSDVNPGMIVAYGPQSSSGQVEADARFVAALRNAAPALLAASPVAQHEAAPADMEAALRWTAGILQEIVSGRWKGATESDKVSIGSVTKTISQVLDMADAALGRASQGALADVREPDAYVPVHPRNGPLWASTITTLEADRPRSYPVKPVYLGVPTAQPEPPAADERATWDNARESLAIAMAGFANRSGNRDFNAAISVLDAITEPGLPLSWLRTARAPRTEVAGAVPVQALFLTESRMSEIAHKCEVECQASPGTNMWQCAYMAIEETINALAEPHLSTWIAEVCEDADGYKHIEAVIEALDDLPKGMKLYGAPQPPSADAAAAPADERAVYLPCPICCGVEGCDHTVPERQRAARAAASQPAAAAGQEAVGCLTVSRFRGLVNTDFDYYGSLSDGSYEVYTARPAQVATRQRLTDEQWYDLASRHANAEWNSDGYLASVKSLCDDYRALLEGAKR